ncbi:sugar ABC transporter ATP-binding protein [Allgaiera indica]|uniref:Monosaccharide ABC transporter ATP-binding protein, CUT2 family n=1 Tax=Allgaiera indica TaxID=765699 RepID=A0AAN4UQV2_9RHOB|nr:sugar ABC transporter ATP-binding protein [Allgaiera indica]GHE01214.1 sugar ABC transporter ATP-binding protein [Allgaiera indica]SDW82819.1 monosaccharide ABC transporter ATP-binding protein, CUT2 family [Allgaiera indica]
MLIQTRRLTKRYPGVTALDQVDFDLAAGEVHVLFGENGAGKSTLIALLSGAGTPTSGTIEIDGAPVAFESVAEAQAHGIFTVFQEFSLIPTMSVAQNILLGREPRRGPFIDTRALKARAREVLAGLEFDLPVDQPVSRLSRAAQQMVEIAKAFVGAPRVLILDEPTASLSDHEVDHLFKFILRARARGVGIIYISHRIQEFARIGDRVTVLRDGARIDTVPVAGTSEARLVEMMAGRAIAEIYPKIARRPGKELLRVEDLRAAGVAGVDLTLRAGEVVGLAGLVGSGKSRLVRTIMGLQPPSAGRVTLNGAEITGLSTAAVMARGLHYLSPDRKAEGLILTRSARDNIGIDLAMSPAFRRAGWIDAGAVRRQVSQTAGRVELSPDYLPRPVSQLSGGNQQKVLFAKCFARPAQVYLLDEPTVGVDMGTRAALYQLIRQLAEAGNAVLVVSSDLPEVMNLSHRLLVMAHGRLRADLEGPAIAEDQVLKHFFDEAESEHAG